MIKLEDSRFYNLLPPNLQTPATLALSAALDKQYQKLLSARRRSFILCDIPSLDEDVCDLLALIFKVDGYEVSLAVTKKRQLLEHAIQIMATKGTAAAVQKVIQTIHSGAKHIPWYQYGSDPYMFRVEIDASEQGISENEYEALTLAIDGYKAKRSHLESIDVSLGVSGNYYAGAAPLMGEFLTFFRPFLMR